MRRTTILTAVSTATLALVATAVCGPAAVAKDAPPIPGSGSDTTDHEVLSEVIDTADDLENLHTDLTLSMTIDAEYRSHLYEATLSGEGTADGREGHYRASAMGDGEYESAEYYSDGEQAFTNNAYEGWYEAPVTGADDGIPGGYHSILASLEEIADDLEVRETGTRNAPQYTLQFTGEDQDAFEAFEEAYSLTWEGYSAADTEITVEAVVDAETMEMTSFEFTIEAETIHGTDSLTVEALFSEFGEIEETEVPTWVIDDAERNGRTGDWYRDEGIEEDEIDDSLGLPTEEEADDELGSDTGSEDTEFRDEDREEADTSEDADEDEAPRGWGFSA